MRHAECVRYGSKEGGRSGACPLCQCAHTWRSKRSQVATRCEELSFFERIVASQPAYAELEQKTRQHTELAACKGTRNSKACHLGCLALPRLHGVGRRDADMHADTV